MKEKMLTSTEALAEYAAEVEEAAVVMATVTPKDGEMYGKAMVAFFETILRGAGSSILGAACNMVASGAKGPELRTISLDLDIEFDSNGTPKWELRANRGDGSPFGEEGWENAVVHTTEGLAELIGMALSVATQREERVEAKKKLEKKLKEGEANEVPFTTLPGVAYADPGTDDDGLPFAVALADGDIFDSEE